MAKFRVKGTAAWPVSHPSAPSTEWIGIYEAVSPEEASRLGVEATLAAWKDKGVLSVEAEGAESV